MDEPLLENPDYMPSYRFRDGHLYCEGIRLFPSQLTEREVMKYIPRPYREAFLAKCNKPPQEASDDKK